MPGCGVEVLPSDFKGGEQDIATVIAAEPDVFAHNLETVPRLHERIRPAFGYARSLEVLATAKRRRAGQITKSNLILGMGERPEEVAGSMRDLVGAGCDILTMGQYLQPTSFHLPVDRWVTPEEFAEHKRAGEAMGIRHGAPRRSRRPVLRAGAAYPTASDGPPSCLLDLAPCVACRAASVTRRAGGLLPHRFTLTATASRVGGLLSVALPRGHPRPALTGTLPFGVRTFLERERPRPPGRLLHARAYRRGRGAPRVRRPPPR